MKRYLLLKVLAVWAMILAFVSPVSAQITNPAFTTVSSTVGDGFNVGLALAVSAAVALLIFGYFFKAARRR